jgi:branched-chain amino acid transport system substrate-binding protein
MLALVLLGVMAGRSGSAGDRRTPHQKGVKSAFLIAPNYAAGKDVIAGLKANFKGAVAGEEYSKWPDQLDFSVELAKARAAKPDAVFAFYPGAAGIQFLTQYTQAGLKAQIPLYTAFVIDALSLPRLGELALGIPGAQHWVNDLPNEANKKFVADFRASTAAIRHSTRPRPTTPPSSSTAQWPE